MKRTQAYCTGSLLCPACMNSARRSIHRRAFWATFLLGGVYGLMIGITVGVVAS